MESNLKIWLLAGMVGAMATVLGFLIKVVTGEVIKRLDEIVSELKQLTCTTTIHGQEIRGLHEQDATVREQLRDMAERIRILERNISTTLKT